MYRFLGVTAVDRSDRRRGVYLPIAYALFGMKCKGIFTADTAVCAAHQIKDMNSSNMMRNPKLNAENCQI